MWLYCMAQATGLVLAVALITIPTVDALASNG